MKTHIIKQICLAGALICFSSGVFAIDASKVPKDRQSASGLYFTSVEASDYMKKNATTTLFLDIRDPVEIFTVGMPLAVDHNVPFKFIDPTRWNEKNKTFAMEGNADFSQDVSEQLKAKGLTNKDTIILICGSGKRTAKAANYLNNEGFSKVYSVVDGYSTWQKANLEWSTELVKDKVLVK